MLTYAWMCIAYACVMGLLCMIALLPPRCIVAADRVCTGVAGSFVGMLQDWRNMLLCCINEAVCCFPLLCCFLAATLPVPCGR